MSFSINVSMWLRSKYTGHTWQITEKDSIQDSFILKEVAPCTDRRILVKADNIHRDFLPASYVETHASYMEAKASKDQCDDRYIEASEKTGDSHIQVALRKAHRQLNEAGAPFHGTLENKIKFIIEHYKSKVSDLEHKLQMYRAELDVMAAEIKELRERKIRLNEELSEIVCAQQAVTMPEPSRLEIACSIYAANIMHHGICMKGGESVTKAAFRKADTLIAAAKEVAK